VIVIGKREWQITAATGSRRRLTLPPKRQETFRTLGAFARHSGSIPHAVEAKGELPENQ
jgi:hypothetical protein